MYNCLFYVVICTTTSHNIGHFLFYVTMIKSTELRKYAFPDQYLLDFFLVLVGTTTSQNIRHFNTLYKQVAFKDINAHIPHIYEAIRRKGVY